MKMGFCFSRCYWNKKVYIFLIKITLFLLVSVFYIGCSASSKKRCLINDDYEKCMSEMQVYENSLHQWDNVTSNKNADFLPVNVKKINNKDSSFYDDSLFYRTWVSSHVNESKMVIGEHYIYWNLQLENSTDSSNVKSKNILQPFL